MYGQYKLSDYGQICPNETGKNLTSTHKILRKGFYCTGYAPYLMRLRHLIKTFNQRSSLSLTDFYENGLNQAQPWVARAG
jgi:hypothetical protein